MKLDIAYYHDTNKVSLGISLYANEEDFAIGFGATCEEAEKNLRGWIGADSDLIKSKRRLNLDISKPYIAIIKRKADGSQTKTSKCINILNDRPTGTANQITIRNVDF